jgi:predicted small secreted protein
MRASLLLVLVAGVLLTGCGTMSAKDVLRSTQSAVNLKNMYEGSSVKEEVVWRIRSAVGQ